MASLARRRKVSVFLTTVEKVYKKGVVVKME